MVALSCGVPVVHPPFTEVSPLVAAYDAGWLVDPADPEAVDAVFDEVVGRPEVVAAKAAGARRLWRGGARPGGGDGAPRPPGPAAPVGGMRP